MPGIDTLEMIAAMVSYILGKVRIIDAKFEVDEFPGQEEATEASPS